ncbi:alternative ribosome rescue aminoacyl-tRNA hydrolase ArfB [Massilia suwonensis]|uniref:Alternative ribosome rescue aminoacyl-tRNA hydrolase ArfB n=1 Tax=Massilia suwonensis TaxID=648895 RepID=A0ABW0MQM8_9BURK
MPSYPGKSKVTPAIDPSEVEFIAIRAQGPGGQNVNKVSCAVHARFDVRASSLPEDVKERLLEMRDTRITREGVLVLKAQQSRSLEQNKEDALQRLQALVDAAAVVQAVRRPTKPTRSSQRRRLDEKTRSGQIKALRGRVSE